MRDVQLTEDLLKERCYIRYVDVFSAHPRFAAQFVFGTPKVQGQKVEFDGEAGTQLKNTGLPLEGAFRFVLWSITVEH